MRDCATFRLVKQNVCFHLVVVFHLLLAQKLIPQLRKTLDVLSLLLQLFHNFCQVQLQLGDLALVAGDLLHLKLSLRIALLLFLI